MARKIAEVFNGAIPPICLSQIMRSVDFSTWNSVWVGCSGTFSFERAIAQRYPQLDLHGNDVSLLSHVIQSLALDKPFEFRFTNRVAQFERYLEGHDYRDRCAAMVMVLALSRIYGSDNDYNRRHWRSFEADFDRWLTYYREHLDKMVAEVKLTDYYAGDFRDHLDRCLAVGGGFVISAPFIAGWYEGWFRFINANIEWPEPSFRRWDPTDFPEIVDILEDAKAPYVAVYKAELADRPLVAYHRVGSKPQFYVYANNTATKASTVNQGSENTIIPFRFKAVDVERVKADSQVAVYPVHHGHANYIKSLFMQENINFTSGRVNYIVFIDDMVAGVLTYDRPTVAVGEWKSNEYVYLLSDCSTTRYGRVAKLLALLASSKQVAADAAHRIIHRAPKAIVTTVRSNMPVSMKYRGIYNIVKKTPAPPGELSGAKWIIGYASEPRDLDPQQIFEQWFAKHFKDDRNRKVTNSYGKSATTPAAEE